MTIFIHTIQFVESFSVIIGCSVGLDAAVVGAILKRIESNNSTQDPIAQ